MDHAGSNGVTVKHIMHFYSSQVRMYYQFYFHKNYASLYMEMHTFLGKVQFHTIPKEWW